MSAVLDSVVSRLKDVRRSGKGWMTRCPAHQDRSPSLSVCERDGRVLIHCFAGCTTEAVCEAIGVRMADLFAGQATRENHLPRIVRAAQREIAGLRNRLTPRERVLPVTVVVAELESLDVGLARAIALAVEGEIVQVVEGL